MKFIQNTEAGREEVVVMWKDHYPACEKCREVDVSKSATFVSTCVVGSQLLMEHLSKMQAPVVRQRRQNEARWAMERKTFVIDRPSREQVERATRYVESE